MFKKLFVGIVSSTLLIGISGITAYASTGDKIVQHLNMHNDSKTHNERIVQSGKRHNDKIVQHLNTHNDTKIVAKAQNESVAQSGEGFNDKIAQHLSMHSDTKYNVFEPNALAATAAGNDDK